MTHLLGQPILSRGAQSCVGGGWSLSVWGLVALTLCVGGCAGPPPTQSTARIGVIDGQRVLEETKAGQAAKESLNEFMKNRQALIKLEENELKRMESELIKQASVLSANARKAREEKFRRRMLLYQQKTAELNREVQDKQREVLGAFREDVERIVAQVAREQGLAAVLETGRGGPLVYSDANIDISDRVIQELNRGIR